jgi:hypothetical protein
MLLLRFSLKRLMGYEVAHLCLCVTFVQKGHPYFGKPVMRGRIPHAKLSSGNENVLLG